jgi:hypothetical protein
LLGSFNILTLVETNPKQYKLYNSTFVNKCLNAVPSTCFVVKVRKICFDENLL